MYNNLLPKYIYVSTNKETVIRLALNKFGNSYNFKGNGSIMFVPELENREAFKQLEMGKTSVKLDWFSIDERGTVVGYIDANDAFEAI